MFNGSLFISLTQFVAIPEKLFQSVFMRKSNLKICKDTHQRFPVFALPLQVPAFLGFPMNSTFRGVFRNLSNIYDGVFLQK